MPHNKKAILVVDDSAMNREVVKRILGQDFEIIEAENGQEALDQLKRFGCSISAILLDVVMPVMDGFAFLMKQQKMPHISTIPVIVVTDRGERQTEMKALSLGASDFVTKPFDHEIIKRRLSNIIRLRETAEIVHRLERDPLTALYNKDTFYDRIEKIIGEVPEKTYQIVAADIEHFKLFNDTYGMEEGDNLLIFCANLISKWLKKRNGIAARLGSDQFLMFLSADTDEVEDIAEAINNDLKQYPAKSQPILRFGIYSVNLDDRIPIAAMCDRALLAIREIKGKYGQVYKCYDELMFKEMQLEQEIVNVMGEALAAGEFKMYIQPKYDLNKNSLAGAETLVRWISPVNGFLSPEKFIPLFEKNGFITQLDQFMWEETCKLLRYMIDKYGKYVPVSVNVSRADIYMPDMPDILCGIVKKYGLEPHHLHLEITETAYTDNPDQLVVVVDELKSRGFAIEMDDFGSGYSSLNMLSELPIDILKLDMKFIQKDNIKNSGNILSFIISMAKWLNLMVVAEGVETEEQVQMLRNMECEYVQGYYYAKPMQTDDFIELFKKADIAVMPQHKEEEEKMSDFVMMDNHKDKTMLIVDDTKLNRSVLADFFKNSFNIVEVDNGLKALKYVERYKDSIAIIMLDLIMPVVDGFETLERLKRSREYADIPVIVTSVIGDSSEVRALEMGASDYLSKPYNLEVAKHRVRNAISERVYRMDKDKS